MYQEWLETLQSSAIFRGIDPSALNIMLECLKPRIKQYRYREIVAVSGQPFQGIGILAHGRIALTKETYSGNRIMMAILNTGDIFGEMVAFSDSRVCPVTVIAQEDCHLLFLPPNKILGNCPNLCPSHSILIMNLLNILSNKALMLNKKIEHLSAKNVRGKIGSYLLETSRQTGQLSFTVPMKRHELADYLGLPRPSLSREMARMRDAGLINYAGSQIQINDILALEKSIS